MISMKEYSRSLALHQRASNVLAGGVSSEFRKFSQPHPLFYGHAKGSRIWDVDRNEYGYLCPTPKGTSTLNKDKIQFSTPCSYA